MHPKLAYGIFLFLVCISIPAASYPIYEFVRVIEAIQEQATQVEFDSGDFYLLLMSIFWAFVVIEYTGTHKKNPRFIKHYASKIILYWFIASIALANILPFFLVSQLERAGYQKCEVASSPSRISRGEVKLYQLDNCKKS